MTKKQTMKKLTLFLALILSVSAIAQKKVLLKDDGTHEIQGESPDSVKVLEQLVIDPSVSNKTLDLYLENRKDTVVQYLETARASWESWYLVSKETHKEVSVYKENGVIKSKERIVASQKNHQVLTVIFFIVFLILVIIAVVPLFHDIENYQEMITGYSLTIVIAVGLVFFLLNLLVCFNSAIVWTCVVIYVISLVFGLASEEGYGAGLCVIAMAVIGTATAVVYTYIVPVLIVTAIVSIIVMLFVTGNE